MDENDPNYDSAEDKAVPSSGGDGANHKVSEVVAGFKRNVTSILQEYLDSGDINEASCCFWQMVPAGP